MCFLGVFPIGFCKELLWAHTRTNIPEYIKGSLLPLAFAKWSIICIWVPTPPLISVLLLVAFCMPCTTNGLDNCLHASHVSSSWLKMFHHFRTISSYVTYPFCGDHIINHGLVQLLFLLKIFVVILNQKNWILFFLV